MKKSYDLHIALDKIPYEKIAMRISKRQLKRIIREEYSRLKRRGLLQESIAHFQKLARLLVEDEKEAVIQAIELAISLGYFKVEQYMESQAGGQYAMASAGTKRKWKLQAVPEFFDILVEEMKNSKGKRVRYGSSKEDVPEVYYKKSLRTHDDPDIHLMATGLANLDFYGYQIDIHIVDKDMRYPHKKRYTIINRY